jgi:anaerobic selenocysteine-containing dehydrogenase
LCRCASPATWRSSRACSRRCWRRRSGGPGTVFDHDFIRAHTHGYEAFVEDLRGESWELIVEQSGVERAQIRSVARW